MEKQKRNKQWEAKLLTDLLQSLKSDTDVRRRSLFISNPDAIFKRVSSSSGLAKRQRWEKKEESLDGGPSLFILDVVVGKE